MKNLNKVLLMGGVAVLLSLSTSNAAAQQQRQGRGGNFDPAEFRQRMLDRYKEQLEVKSDDEWKVIADRIEKVTTLQREVRIAGFGGPGGRRGGGGDRNADGNNGNNRTNRFGGEPNPDVEALQKALEAKASADELKTKLSKLRDAQKEKEAKLSKAQDDLRKVLSVRQEATAVLMGLLK